MNNKRLELDESIPPVIMIRAHRNIQRILKNFITIVADFSNAREIFSFFDGLKDERNRQQKWKEFSCGETRKILKP